MDNYTPLTYTPFDPSHIKGKRTFPLKALLMVVALVGVSGGSFFVFQGINSSRVLRDTSASEPVVEQVVPTTPPLEPTTANMVASESAMQQQPTPEETEVPTSLEEFLNKRRVVATSESAISP